MIAQQFVNTMVNVVLLAALPFGIYAGVQKWRHGQSLGESAARAGLRLGEPRYIGYAALVAAVGAAATIMFMPAEVFLREGSPQAPFLGLGLGGQALVLAFLYGVVATGFCEELLFRGLIGGSLARWLGPVWGNVAQAAVFLAPHLLLLFVIPDAWGMMPVIFVGALIAGWIRIASGSIVGPWLIHASVNVATCLLAAVAPAA